VLSMSHVPVSGEHWCQVPTYLLLHQRPLKAAAARRPDLASQPPERDHPRAGLH
jgi:hypothetical protein